ncbi:hypothetical protein NIES298_17920 [Microcystis aeruginosa NIES-298]|nr:hypothetical protein NIES298_17920 [Microcystis aeruginosa NIES-298]
MFPNQFARNYPWISNSNRLISPLPEAPLAFSAEAIQWTESWQNKTPVLTPTI